MPPNRIDASKIVEKQFSQQKEKKLDAAKQADTLRQQTANQKALTSDRAREKKDPLTEENKTHDTLRSSHDKNLKGVKETNKDGFLQKTSTSHLQRQAGKSFSKQPQARHQNVKGWSVRNSPQTSPQARQLILNRPVRPRTFKFIPKSANKNLTKATHPRTSQPSPKAQPKQQVKTRENLVLHYFRRANSQGRKNPLIHTRSFSTQKFSEKIQKLLQERFASLGQKFAKEPNPQAVHIRAGLVFIKDKNQFRTFRLEKDGTLTELPSEDAGPHPLSHEAKLLLQKVLRRRGLQQEQQRAALKDEVSLQRGKLDGKLAQKIHSDISHQEKTLDFETRFALLLHDVLEEEKKIKKSLDGEDPHFPSKKDWEAFFSRMLNMGNQEKAASTSFDSLMSLIFRGLFKKLGNNVMVGDFKFLQAGKSKEEKFGQMVVDSEELLALLAKMEPGQTLTPEMLRKFFADQLNFLKLAHLAEQANQGAKADEAGKNIVFNPKASIDQFSQARLEQSLLLSRKNKNSGSESATSDSQSGEGGIYGKDGFFANAYEWLGLRERYRGKPRLYTLIAYLTITTIIGITAAFFLLKGI